MQNKPYSLYYDKEKTKLVGDKINLGISEAGQVNTKELFLENQIEFTINYLLEVTAGELIIVNTQGTLSSGKIVRIPLKTEPSIKSMQAIEGKIKIKINYVVE